MVRSRCCRIAQIARRRGAAAALFAALATSSTMGEASPGKAGPAPSPDPPPDYLRPALEIAAGLGAASIWYFVDDRNVLDWDNPSVQQRLNGEAWRFDNNTFELNYVWHPLAGSGMYMLARGNRLGAMPSFLYSLAGSTAWEYVIEFNEKVSVNDMIVTPLGGLAVGEFFHKLALRLSGGPPRGVRQQALAWTFGLSVHGHRTLDGLGPPPEAAGLWDDLSLGYGFGIADMGQERGGRFASHVLAFEGTLSSLPGYRRPGRFERWFHDAEITSFALELDVGVRGVGGDVMGETRLAGYHAQALAGSERRPRGAFANGALGVAYAYRNTEAFGFDDRRGLLLFPGFTGEVGLRGGALRGGAALRAYPSFGGMSAPGFERWRRQVPEARTKTVLEREGYFYGWGFHGALEASVGYRSLDLRGELEADYFESFEGLDRAQERVAVDPHIVERPLRGAFSIGATELPDPLEVRISFEKRWRLSHMPGVEETLGGERVLMRIAIPL